MIRAAIAATAASSISPNCRWKRRGAPIPGRVGLAALDFPDPTVPNTGMVLVKGWVLDPISVAKIELYVDDQFIHTVNSGLPRIDIIEAYPNYPGIQNIAPGYGHAISPLF